MPVRASLPSPQAPLGWLGRRPPVALGRGGTGPKGSGGSRRVVPWGGDTWVVSFHRSVGHAPGVRRTIGLPL
jgi:hypothetical protein